MTSPAKISYNMENYFLIRNSARKAYWLCVEADDGQLSNHYPDDKTDFIQYNWINNIKC